MNREKMTLFKERYMVDFSSFHVLSSMLLANRFKVSFKDDWKKSLGRVFSFILAFAVISAAFYLFYYLTSLLTIFSALPFVPLSVPSFLSSCILILSFFSLMNNFTKDLYFSDDNKVLLTYPTNGNTLLFSRLIAYFIYEYIHNIYLQVPIFVGYIICFHYPYYLIVWVLVSFFFLTFAEMGVAALFSIPLYGLQKILKKHSLVRFLSYLIFYGTLTGLCAYAVSLVPNHIDIFTNWGSIFSKIQSFLNGYTNHVPFLFMLTQGLCGFAQSGTTALLFQVDGWIGLGIALGVGILCLFIALIIINPLFLKFASSSLEDGSLVIKKTHKSHHHSPFVSSLHKEMAIFFRNPSAFMPFLGTCVFVPLLTILLNKFYGAINTDYLGDVLIEVTEFLVVGLSMTNSSSFLVDLYSKDSEELTLEASYPLNPSLLLFSKAFLPGLLASISIIVSVSFYGVYVELPLFQTIFLAIALLALYHGHLLFTIKEASKAKSKGLSQGGNSLHAGIMVSFLAFVIPIAFSALFYLYLVDGFLAGAIKIMALCLIYLAISSYSYVRYSKYLFGEGQA
jgi:hypothetical protein